MLIICHDPDGRFGIGFTHVFSVDGNVFGAADVSEVGTAIRSKYAELMHRTWDVLLRNVKLSAVILKAFSLTNRSHFVP